VIVLIEDETKSLMTVLGLMKVIPVSEPSYHDWTGPEWVLLVACLTLKVTEYRI
jgi:hypothetical protein